MKINIEFSEKQQQAYDVLTNDHTLFLLFGGAARGAKSWLGCVWLILQAIKYPNTHYFIGRVELQRLKKTTIRTFFKAAKYYGFKVGKDGGHFWFHGGENSIMFQNGSVIDLLDLRYLPSDPLYERYGSSEYTQGWIEEAGEVDFGAFDVLKSRIGQHLNDMYDIPPKMLITANPKKNWLYDYFYKSMVNNTLPREYAFIQSFATDNPWVEQGTIERLQGIKNKAQRERLLEGNWEYADEPDQLIPYDLIYEAIGYQPSAGQIPHALGVDVARFGDDESVISYVKNSQLKFIKQYKDLRTTEVAEKIVELNYMLGVSADSIRVDAVGLGAGVLDSLQSVHGISATEIQSAGKPTINPDNEFALEFANIRTQLWWEFKRMLEKKEFGISSELEGTDELEQLISDLTSIKYQIVRDRFLAVESKDSIKKRLGRSPDIGDSVIYAAAESVRKDDFYFAVL